MKREKEIEVMHHDAHAKVFDFGRVSSADHLMVNHGRTRRPPRNTRPAAERKKEKKHQVKEVLTRMAMAMTDRIVVKANA